MLTVLSPAKSQDFSIPLRGEYTQPALLDESAHLMQKLQKLEVEQIEKLMSVSEKIATLNHERFRNYHTPFTTENARQAVLAFRGDVYTGLDADSLSDESIQFGQKHLRLLSGLYGLLRPLDLIQPYRLEMKTKLESACGKDLYQFWGSQLSETLNAEWEGSPYLINLASKEYSKAIDFKALGREVITPNFKEKKGEGYKIIAIYAKKARGMMARYILENRLDEPEGLKGFSADGYQFNEALSNLAKGDWVFTRG